MKPLIHPALNARRKIKIMTKEVKFNMKTLMLLVLLYDRYLEFGVIYLFLISMFLLFCFWGPWKVIQKRKWLQVVHLYTASGIDIPLTRDFHPSVYWTRLWVPVEQHNCEVNWNSAVQTSLSILLRVSNIDPANTTLCSVRFSFLSSLSLIHRLKS